MQRGKKNFIPSAPMLAGDDSAGRGETSAAAAPPTASNSLRARKPPTVMVTMSPSCNKSGEETAKVPNAAEGALTRGQSTTMSLACKKSGRETPKAAEGALTHAQSRTMSPACKKSGREMPKAAEGHLLVRSSQKGWQRKKGW
jgi:hypothetical protein